MLRLCYLAELVAVSGGWAGSGRRDRLPSWWPVTVRRIIARDPDCRCTGCPRCARSVVHPEQPPYCFRASQEADHIVAGDNHKDDNLRGICRPCHAHKSSGEGIAAKAEKKRPTGFFDEKHPGHLG